MKLGSSDGAEIYEDQQLCHFYACTVFAISWNVAQCLSLMELCQNVKLFFNGRRVAPDSVDINMCRKSALNRPEVTVQ